MPRIAEDLIQATSGELQRQGFEATTIDHTASQTPDSDALFREAEISRLCAPISSKVSGTRGTPSRGHSIECTLGQEAKNLATFAGSDGLIFVHFAGRRRSGGTVATEMAFKVLLSMAGGYSPQDPIGAGELETALVDGRTGDVQWTNRVARTRFGFDPSDFEREEPGRMTRELF